MIEAVVLADASTAPVGARHSKETSTTPRQTEASAEVWAADGLRSGIWEATPGTFSSTRDGYHEICQILSGRATIEEPGGRTFDIAAGSLFITPAGWTGTWTIHETLRKSWAVFTLPVQGGNP
jgi:uncharacterized protein